MSIISSKPAFYFIGGPSFSGKFEVAKLLMAKRPVESVSTDGLRRVLWANVPETADPQLHRLQHAKVRSFTNDDDWIAYAEAHADEIIDGQEKIEAPRVWERGVLPYVDCNYGRGVDTLFQGVHVLPGLVATLKSIYDVRAVFIGNRHTPTEAFVAHVLHAAHANPNHWAKDWSDRKLRAYLTHVIPMTSERFALGAERYGFLYFDLSEGDHTVQQELAAAQLCGA